MVLFATPIHSEDNGSSHGSDCLTSISKLNWSMSVWGPFDHVDTITDNSLESLGAGAHV